MTKTSLLAIPLILLLAVPLSAGVVFEIETTDHDASPPKVETTEVAAEGKNLKMGVPAGEASGRGDGTVIFRGDRREMVVVDHDDKSYVVIDEATMKQIGGQVSAAMKQMEEALKNVPEDQRAMVEKMMKERMPQQQAARPTNEVRKTGDRKTVHGYPAVRYEVFLGGEKAREMWVTDWSNVEGGAEVMGAFGAMADFMEEMLDSLPQSPAGGGFGDSVLADMKKLDGFPVVTRELDSDGSLESESTLRSSRRRTLDPAEFEPPAGYKRRSMMGGS